MASRGAGRGLLAAFLVIAAGQLGGCNLDSFFNPSVIGYWEYTPTTIPILERIDAIESEDDYWGQTTDPIPEDLIPSDLTYRTGSGDIVTVAIFELQEDGRWTSVTRRVDQRGFVRIPELGEIQAGGRTVQELEDALLVILKRSHMVRPQVDIVVEQKSAFNFTIYGFVAAPGIYSLITPDLRLLDALATAGGVPPSVDTLYIIRQVSLSDEVKPSYERRGNAPGEGEAAPADEGETRPAIDIDDLIEQLDDEGDDGNLGILPGVFRSQEDPPPVDIDDLLGVEQPMRAQDPPPAGQDPPTGAEPAIDIDRLGRGGEDDAWIYIEERGEWVRVSGEDQAAVADPGDAPLFVERIIKIPADRLQRGDSKYNIVVRPKDRIYLEPPPTGVIYVDGQIVRPGTFNLPNDGITLSRLVAAAGGLGQLAIPERVDLIRMVGPNREAAIRLNLAAIRKRTEPDILLKPNDHVIIGTSWIALPMAIVRNGFRATYGFGFLLDRNFGNDVFGPPPTVITNR